MDCSFILKLWIAVSIDKNKHPLRSITEGHGCKIHYTDSEERDTMAYNGKKLYYLPFSVLALSMETSGYPFTLWTGQPEV